MARHRRGAPAAGGGGGRPAAAAAAAVDQQQEAKEGTSPMDLTSIRLREDEEERREQEQQVESPDLPTVRVLSLLDRRVLRDLLSS